MNIKMTSIYNKLCNKQDFILFFLEVHIFKMDKNHQMNFKI
jgi:hypothetical protein